MRTTGMRVSLYMVTVLTLQLLMPSEIHADAYSGHCGFMLGLQSGYGHVLVRSDQDAQSAKGTFSLGFQGGYAVSPRLVLGLDIGGWLLQPFNLHDESQGESISNVELFLHVFPIARLPVYLRTAIGHASYTANDPAKRSGGAWGSWLMGGGYELRASTHWYLAAQISYGRGRFSDVPDILGRETGRRYEVTDISVALHWYSRN